MAQEAGLLTVAPSIQARILSYMEPINLFDGILSICNFDDFIIRFQDMCHNKFDHINPVSGAMLLRYGVLACKFVNNILHSITPFCYTHQCVLLCINSYLLFPIDYAYS